MSNLLSNIPIIGGLFDNSDEQALEQLKKNQALYGGISLPDLQRYNPEAYQYQGDYTPEQMQGKQISEDPSLRNNQLSALQRMAGLAQTGLSDVDQAGFQNARDMGNQMARSGREAAMLNAQARGQAGSGLEFASREMANQEGASRAQQAGLQQAGDSARQRALYNQAYLQGESGLRSQDYGVNAMNTDIMNRFNQMNTQNNNQAQLRNLGERQNIGNANVQGRNQAQQYNNQLAEMNYQNALSRASGISGANTGMAQGYGAENSANTGARNANTALGATVGMGLAGYGPMSKKKSSSDDEGYEGY